MRNLIDILRYTNPVFWLFLAGAGAAAGATIFLLAR